MSSSSLSPCPHCPDSSRLFSSRGLKIHIGRMHKNETSAIKSGSRVAFAAGSTLSPGGSLQQGVSFQNLAKLKRDTPVLRHIPRGARSLAAEKLSQIINSCVVNNGVEDWCSLLTFSFKALKTPSRSDKGGMVQKVKNNIGSFDHCCLDSPEIDEGKSFGSQSVSRAIETKVHEGDLRGAVRLLMSDDTIAQSAPETLDALRSKHPSPSRPLVFPEPPDRSCSPLTVTVEDVSLALGSFYSGSAAGLDGIRPGHLKELTSSSAGDNGQRLLESLCRLCNFLLSGQLNREVCPYLYGASLCAITKKDGGVRPIAIGSTFRRLTAKLACRAVKEEMAAYLQPHQLGFGTRLGCEAAIHATRAFATGTENANCIIVKLDLKNAFNTLERDVLLREVRGRTPSLYPFLHQVYEAPSNLYYGDSLIKSQVGAQQGDPLGPLTFSLAIQASIHDLKSPLNVWYLDDGILGGKPEDVEQDIRTLIPRLRELGLEVNSSKCEFFPCGPEAEPGFSHFSSFLPGLTMLSPISFSLLGAPIFPVAVPEALEDRRRNLLVAHKRLKDLSAHVALILLRMCFAVPKLTYFLRTAPTWWFPQSLSSFDEALKEAIESILNVSLNEAQWAQAALPIRLGGLGVRRAQDVGLPAFLASAHGVTDLVARILSLDGEQVSIPFAADALAAWSGHCPGSTTPKEPQVQRSWDDVGAKAVLAGLIDRAEGVELARLKAVSRSESGAWLQALPSPHLGTLLDGESLRVAVALRLGCDVCEPHICICGSRVEANGHHALSCCRCSGRFPRHHALNDIVRRALVGANIPCVLEPPGLCRLDGKRPDGLTLVPWQKGKCLLWDATCVSTFAASHLPRTVGSPGAAAESAALKKRAKYAALEPKYYFVPLAVETTGCWGSDAIKFVAEIGRRLRERGGDPRSGSFLVQRLALAIQRGNAASVMGSFAPGTSRDFY